MSTIGERIKARRIELNMSQDELAKKTGYKSRSSINKIELSRDLPMRKVNLFALALDTTVAYIMGWQEIPDDVTKIGKLAAEVSTNAQLQDMVESYLLLSEQDKKTVYNLIQSLAKK